MSQWDLYFNTISTITEDTKEHAMTDWAKEVARHDESTLLANQQAQIEALHRLTQQQKETQMQIDPTPKIILKTDNTLILETKPGTTLVIQLDSITSISLNSKFIYIYRTNSTQSLQLSSIEDLYLQLVQALVDHHKSKEPLCL